jgi:hypothetical protein
MGFFEKGYITISQMDFSKKEEEGRMIYYYFSNGFFKEGRMIYNYFH